MEAVAKLDSILDFAAYLQRSLVNQGQSVDDLSVHLQVLPLSYEDLSSSDRAKLNKQGVALWNLCGRLRKTEQLLARKELLGQARAFAFLLLESASEANNGSLKNALQVVSECLDAKLVKLALKISEWAAVLQDTLAAGCSYSTEYLLLRLTLAWKQDRLDLADHFFTKLQTEAAQSTAAAAQYSVDLFLDIGRDSLAEGHNEVAAKWLERAIVMLEEHDLGGPDAADLRLNVLHTYARALLRLKDADTGLLRARGVLETLRRFYRADNVAMVLLQLEIASRGDPDAQFDWVDTLPSLQLTDSHNKAVMHHLHRLRKLDPERARRVLQRYLVERLAVNGNDQWIESALITLVWMPTSPEYRDETTTLEAAFTGLSQMWAKSLSAEAVHRVLVLLWKRIEEAFDREAYRAAEAWCRLAMHELLFDNMDDLKVGKVKRKFLQCLLNQSNPEAAREAILTMAPAVIDGFSLLELEWVSKTLFNLALRFYKVWSSADTIQLLGHTAHLLLRVFPGASVADEDKPLVEGLQKRRATSLFALAVLHTTEARIADSVQARIKNYKKVRGYVSSFEQQIGSLLGQASHLVPSAPESSISGEVHSTLLACRMTLLPIQFEACLHIPETYRTSNVHDHHPDHLSNIITSAAKYNAPANTHALFADMILCAVSGGDRESEPLISINVAAKLLRQLINAARGTAGYNVLHASRGIRCIVQLIVNGSEMAVENDNMKLLEEVVGQAISLASTGKTREEQRQAYGQEADMPDAGLGGAYPADELEWLAITLFNLAVDYYVGQEEELGKKWARKAVELADILVKSGGMEGDRGGLLARVLRGKMRELGWSV